MTRSSSAARSSWRAVAARGLARNTRRLPPGSDVKCPRARWRSCRRTRLRTTAGPTLRPTTKPTRAGSATGRTSKRPEIKGLPARLPRSRAALNSAVRRSRAAAGSIGSHHPRRQRSDADAGAALAPPRSQHCPACPGAHAEPEAMRLGTTPIVRLKRTLTHHDSRCCGYLGGISPGRHEAMLHPRRTYRANERYAEWAAAVKLTRGPVRRPGDDPGRFPNAPGRAALGCGYRSRSGDLCLPTRPPTPSTRRRTTRSGVPSQRAHAVEKPVDHMWGREVSWQ
jgi:hypothetical protein